MTRDDALNVAFSIGDYAAGGVTGIVVAFAVRAAVSPGADMVLAMLLGMAIGMIVHVAIAAALSPLLGFFHLMVPGSLIGMYGGMAFAMRDSMQHPAGSPGHTCWVGLVFGVAVVGLVRLYDRALQPARAPTGEGGR